MNLQVRRELLRTLKELSELCPNYRFGQMIDNLASMATDGSDEATYKVKDDELLAAARQHLEHRRQAVSEVVSKPLQAPRTETADSIYDDTRNELQSLFRDLSEKCPELRFGQMISNLAVFARIHEGGCTYNVEDDELLAAAKHHLERWKENQAAWAKLREEMNSMVDAAKSAVA